MIASATDRLGGADQVRRFAPMLAVGLAVLLAIFTLPSSLNLPQANPGQVAEYAPVPGNNNQPSVNGNFAGLGLAEGGAPAGGGPGQAQAPGHTVPTTFDCVGNPPRQTADPLSPPCVPAFKGNNGGATYQGVTANRVTILFHFHYDQGTCGSGVGESNVCVPPQGYYDMDKPSDYDQFFLFQYLGAWQYYFNTHYQSYQRKVHFMVYLSSLPANQAQQYNNFNGWGTCSDGETDAALNYRDLHPFAVLDEFYSDAERACYRTYMVQHHVLVFGGQVVWLTQDFYKQFHGLVWEYSETMDRASQNYASWFCTRIAPYPSNFAGQGSNGKKRKFGIVYYDPGANTAGGHTDIDWEKILEGDIKAQCGVTMADKATYPIYQAWSSSGTQSSRMLADMQRFQHEGITSVVMVGASGDDANQASSINYFPEWLIMGDDINDSSLFAAGMPSDEEAHSIALTQQPLQNADGQPVERACYEAITWAWPNIPRDTLDISYACLYYYDDLRQLFTGIQVAGPHLTPESMNEGFHAIPPHPSPGPDQPACFYLPDDYTCFKDVTVEFWDPNAQPASQCGQTCNRSGSYANGCWRMWMGGARFLPGEWPKGNGVAGATYREICNLYQGGSGGVQIQNPLNG